MMFGSAMYEVARARIAEQERAAIQSGEARRQRAEARGRRRRAQVAESAVTTVPAVPDYAEELLEAAVNAVPAPREEAPRGRHAGAGR
jgi:hypothetical protein